MSAAEELRKAAARLRAFGKTPTGKAAAEAIARWLDGGAEQADAAPETVSYRLAVARRVNSGSLGRPQQEAQS